jgi:hypothetical protein
VRAKGLNTTAAAAKAAAIAADDKSKVRRERVMMSPASNQTRSHRRSVGIKH